MNIKYKMPEDLKTHLKGYKYQSDRIQDNMFKVYVDIEKQYLTINQFNHIKMENVTIWAREDNTIRVTFYTDFEKDL